MQSETIITPQSGLCRGNPSKLKIL